MIKAAILGSNGYLGRNLAAYLREKGCRVSCCDIQDASQVKGVRYDKIDITKPEDVAKIDLDVDHLYVFAGITGTADGFRIYEKYIDVNEKGLLHLLTRVRDSGNRPRILFPSTRLVYRGQSSIRLKEDSPKAPKTIYAVNKLMCEQLLSLYRNSFGIDYTIFRICVPYGHLAEGAGSYGTVNAFLESARKGEDITLYGDGCNRRTFTYIGDIFEKIFLAAQKDASNGGVYNVGGQDLSLHEAAAEIADAYHVGVKHVEWPDMAQKIESGDTVFDGTLLDNLTGTSYSTTFKNWVQENSVKKQQGV